MIPKAPNLDGDGNVRDLIWGPSPAMQDLRRIIKNAAPTDIPMLLIGESGTGKEILAQHIHHSSGRQNEPFWKVNSRRLAQGSPLAEFRATDGNQAPNLSQGTVLFDNICELDSTGQRHLLDLLTEDLLERGKGHYRARVISAARRGLAEDLAAGKFLEELYFRLNGISLRVPPLRQRKEDVPELANYFFRKYSDIFDRQVFPVSEELLGRLTSYSWPGNVRQLESTIQRIVVTGEAEAALAELVEIAREVPSLSADSSMSLKSAARAASQQAERELLSKALARTHWNRKRAAQELQISYKALLYKLKQLGLDNCEVS